LPCVSNDVYEIKQAAIQANTSLLKLITETNGDFSKMTFLETITEQFQNKFVPTRVAALNWIFVLITKTPDEIIAFVDNLFTALLIMLTDPSEEVVRLDLEVMAKISLLQENKNYLKLMVAIIELFAKNRQLLENRGSLIIRQLCVFIDAERIYVAMAKILETQEDLEFATIMVQTLNLILLTSSELFQVRANFRNLKTTSKYNELFTTLYRSWSHNPAAVF